MGHVPIWVKATYIEQTSDIIFGKLCECQCQLMCCSKEGVALSWHYIMWPRQQKPKDTDV